MSRPLTTLWIAALVALSGCPKPAPADDPSLTDPPAVTDGPPGPDAPPMARGSYMIEHEQFAQAIPEFDKVLAEDPNNAEATYYRALSYDKTGDAKKAEHGYRAALALNPELVDAMVNLGALYLDDPPRPKKAVDVLASAIAKDPGAADARENLAYAFRLLKDYDESAAHYAAATKLDPSARLEFAFGDMLLEAGKREQAADHFKIALPEFADQLDHLVLMSHTFAKAKRYDDCVVAFGHAIAINDKEPGFFLHRGLCQHALKKEAEARSDYEQALALDPKFQPGWYYLGASWRGEGNDAKAREALDKAWQLDKSSNVGKAAKKLLDKL